MNCRLEGEAVIKSGPPKASEEVCFGKISRKDCELVDLGWHEFWARRGMAPPSDYALYGRHRGLTASITGLQRVTKPNGNNGGKQGGS